MEKYDTYTTEDSENQKIELHKNFRSRKEVLFDVNFIFRKIMHRNLGNVEYDDNAALYAGIEFPKLVTNVETDDLTAAKSPLSGSEILLFDADSVTETNAREAEARMIGGQIKAIVGRELVYDKESRHYRKAEYRDMVGRISGSFIGYGDSGVHRDEKRLFFGTGSAYGAVLSACPG